MELSLHINELVKCRMGKRNKPPARHIYLHEWLKFAGLSIREAAKEAGCHESYISNLANQRKDAPNTHYLLALSEHIGITINDFFKKPPAAVAVESVASLSPQAQSLVLDRKRRKA